MSIKDKLPLLNSSNKMVKIGGYVIYAFVFLMIIGAILPHENTGTVASQNGSDQQQQNPTENNSIPVPTESTIRSYPGFGNYTFDGQDEVTVSLRKATDVVHLFSMEEIPDNYGSTRDSARYTITSTGHAIKGYIDYTNDGYVVILRPKHVSLTKGELDIILSSFKRVD